MAARTSVVIPNYNGIEYLTDCLMAMREQTRKPDRVIVIDNGSADGSPDFVRDHFPEAELICLDTNTGFCGAVNRGIRASKGMDYCILLNNDTRADRRFVECLVRAMEKYPKVFSAQAKMLSMRDPGVMDDAGDLYCSLGWAFARGKGKPERHFRKTEEIFSACAGAAIYRMSMIGEVGLFDENHFAYLEDCDIGWRARIKGYHNIFVPSAKVLHVGSASSGSVYNLFKVKNTSRNSIYLIAKNMPPLMILINLPLLVPGFLVKAAFFAAKGYGKEYVFGIGQGFRLSRTGAKEGRTVRYDRKNLPNYLRIQLELFANVVRRFL